MKYKKIYEVLEQRRSSSPDFRYSDYSGWRSYYRSYMDPPASTLDCSRRPVRWQTTLDYSGAFSVEHHGRTNGS